jgi:hypothetical protein
VTRRTQRRASGEVAPVPPAAKSCPCEPVAPVPAGQGDPAAAGKLLEAPAAAGQLVPGNGEASRGERENPSRSPGSQEALSGAEARKAIAAAQAALNKAKRNRRARPWVERDPYRNAVPGARKMPP